MLNYIKYDWFLHIMSDEIAQTWIGLEVKVRSKPCFNGNLVERSGKIGEMNPRMWLNLASGDVGHIIFCGSGEGIYTIEDMNGRTLYKNNVVLEAYKGRPLREETARDALRIQGVFL